MSSRILQRGDDSVVEPLVWRPAGVPVEAPGSEASPQESSEPQTPAPPPVPAGPSWEEFRSLEQARRDLEKRLPLAEQQARELGRKEGEAAAAAKWREAIERAAASAAQMASLKVRLRREAEQDVVQLSLAIARRILRRELSVDGHALAALVRTALERVELREVHAVRVRREDAPLVTEILGRVGGPARIEVVADAGLEPGAVILETQRGELDASVTVQLEEIERGFADRLGHGGGNE